MPFGALINVGPSNHVLYAGQDRMNPFVSMGWQVGDADFCQFTLDTCLYWRLGLVIACIMGINFGVYERDVSAEILSVGLPIVKSSWIICIVEIDRN